MPNLLYYKAILDTFSAQMIDYTTQGEKIDFRGMDEANTGCYEK